MAETICGFKFEEVVDYDTEENNFSAYHQGKEIDVYRDEDGNFYFTVLDLESGMHDADGYCSSDAETLDDAIQEMIAGAELVC